MQINKQIYQQKLEALIISQQYQASSLSEIDNFYHQNSVSTTSENPQSQTTKSQLITYYDKNSFFAQETQEMLTQNKPQSPPQKKKSSLKKYQKNNYSKEFTIISQNQNSQQGYTCLGCHQDFGIKNKSKGEQILENNFLNTCDCTKNEIQNIVNKIEQKEETPGESFQCDQCSYTTPHKNFLIKHIKNMHIKKLLQCKQCSFQASSIGNINFHIRNSHNDAVYSCNTCQYHATNLQYIKKHIKNMHSQVTHVCQFKNCNYSTLSSESFNRHQRVKHQVFYKNRGY